MFLAHTFRLRDPWQCECTLDGGVRWSRVFHRPTGLEADDALWLVCSGLPPGAAVTLNATRLTPRRARRSHQFEVTSLLADTNRIEIVIPSDSCLALPASQPSALCPTPSPTMSASASSATPKKTSPEELSSSPACSQPAG